MSTVRGYLQWEDLANELEDWLADGSPAPMPEALESRPEGPIPLHLYARVTSLLDQLGEAIIRMEIRRDGMAEAFRAANTVNARTMPSRPAGLVDIGA